MSTVASKPQLLLSLFESGILSGDQWLEVHQWRSAGTSQADVARRLLELGWLTSWQLRHLLAGRFGFSFDGYELRQLLGRGRMGLVFLGRQRSTGRDVAVKVMAKELLQEERTIVRFLREIRLVGQTRHPNVVMAYDAGRFSDGRYYLVTEFVPGRNLAEWNKVEAPLPAPWVCEALREAALGVQHVHEIGVLHRDVKPSNIVASATSVHARPHVKILDFGLGRFTQSSEESRDLTRDGYSLGTVDYSAPEQIRDARTVDFRADIYSLGMTLFHLLAGCLPYQHENPMINVTAKLSQDPPLVSDFRSGLPPELVQLVARMIAREPGQRPSTAGEVAEALRPFGQSSVPQ